MLKDLNFVKKYSASCESSPLELRMSLALTRSLEGMVTRVALIKSDKGKKNSTGGSIFKRKVGSTGIPIHSILRSKTSRVLAIRLKLRQNGSLPVSSLFSVNSESFMPSLILL